MKRGTKPLARKKPMARKAMPRAKVKASEKPLDKKEPAKRALSSSRKVKPRKALRPRSAKMEAKYAGEKCSACDAFGSVYETDGSERICETCKGTGRTEGRRELVARLLRERPYCEAGPRICAFLEGAEPEDAAKLGALGGYPRHAWVDDGKGGVREGHRCDGLSVDVHEILARSAGGSILDEANCLCVCRADHLWIGDHPKEALALGLRASRYGKARTEALAKGDQPPW